MPKLFYLLLLTISPLLPNAQLPDLLNTAKDCNYMKQSEKEMIWEINKLRTDPSSYLPYIEPMLISAKTKLKNQGKGQKSYSVQYSTSTVNGIKSSKIDTVWHYTQEEEVKALSSLVKDLKTTKKLSILLPDSGIYNAAQKHAKDGNAHEWEILHTGSDGSRPWERITKFSPRMSFGNENLAGAYPEKSALNIVIQLLIDDGIPGYGHRYNILDPKWTHVACVSAGLSKGMYWWVQNFGMIREGK